MIFRFILFSSIYFLPNFAIAQQLKQFDCNSAPDTVVYDKIYLVDDELNTAIESLRNYYKNRNTSLTKDHLEVDIEQARANPREFPFKAAVYSRYNYSANEIWEHSNNFYSKDFLPEYKWIKVTCNAEFAPRDGAGAVFFKNFLWLIGGWNPIDKINFPKICNNEVWNSKDGHTWNLVKKNTFGTSEYNPEVDWEGRHTAGYVVFKDKMWIVGGDANQGHYQYDVWNSENGRDWNKVADSVPWGPRVLHQTFVFQNKIWIMGGQTVPQIAPAKEIFYSDLWNSEDGKNWKKVSDNNLWNARGLIGGNIVFNNSIWILGGGKYETPSYSAHRLYNDIWSSNDGVKWNLVKQTAEWDPRVYHDIAIWDNKIWVIGGTSVGFVKGLENRNDVWYSEDGKNWINLPKTPWTPRHATSLYSTDECLYVVGGNNMESDVWKLCRKKTTTKTY